MGVFSGLDLVFCQNWMVFGRLDAQKQNLQFALKNLLSMEMKKIVYFLNLHTSATGTLVTVKVRQCPSTYSRLTHIQKWRFYDA